MKNHKLIDISRSQAAATRFAKDLTIEELEKAISHLQHALVTAKEREASKAAKRQAADLKKLKALIEKTNLSSGDIRDFLSDKGAGKGRRKISSKRKTGPLKGKKIAPKYAIKVGKKTYKWTGRGRTPLVFKEFVENGGSLEQCLIK